MKATKITEEEISSCAVSSLPTSPTSSTIHGGSGYSSEEMKAAFDRLPLLLVRRFNDLYDDIMAERNLSISGGILTGIYQGHCLADMFYEISSGGFAGYLDVGGKSLATELYEIKEAIRALGGEI